MKTYLVTLMVSSDDMGPDFMHQKLCEELVENPHGALDGLTVQHVFDVQEMPPAEQYPE